MKTSLAMPTIPTVRTPLRLALLGLLSSLLSLAPLHAGVLFTFQEVGSDVVATTSGTIASGWSRNFNGTFNANSNTGVVSFDGLNGQSGGIYYLATGTLWENTNQMTGVPTTTDGTVTGDTFGFAGASNFYVPTGTAVGDAITPNTTITWANETFASLNLDTALSTTPLVLFTLDNSETISAVRGEPVPEPTSVALLFTGVAGCVAAGGMRRRRRLSQAAGDR